MLLAVLSLKDAAVNPNCVKSLLDTLEFEIEGEGRIDREAGKFRPK